MMGSIMSSEASFTCVKPAFPAEVEQVLGSQCIGLQEGLAILADAMQWPEEMMPKITPNATSQWARLCSLYKDPASGFNFSITWKQLDESLQDVPCMCRWLSLVKRIAAPHAIPTKQGLQSILEPFRPPTTQRMPQTYDCPKDPSTDEFQCSLPADPMVAEMVSAMKMPIPPGNVMHLYSMEGMRIATPVGPPNP